MEGGWSSYAFDWYVRLNVTTALLATGLARPKNVAGGVRLHAPRLRWGCEKERINNSVASPPRDEDARVYRVGVLEAFRFICMIHTALSFPKGQHPEQLQRRAGGWALIIEHCPYHLAKIMSIKI